MPNGKLAGERCVQLTTDNRCRIFGLPERPTVCLAFTADAQVCGETNQQAMAQLNWLEQETAVFIKAR